MKDLSLKRIFVSLVGLFLTFWLVGFWVLKSPILSFNSNLLKASVKADLLKSHVEFLASMTPNRSIFHPMSLTKAGEYIEAQFKGMGLNPQRQEYTVEGNDVFNIVIEISNSSNQAKPLLVIGAHYDVAGGESPGADDNASGVAGLIEIGRLLKDRQADITVPIQLVAYSTEEPPYFASKNMGSAVHAKSLKDKGRKVEMMISLEMLGYYSDEWFSQNYPMPLMYMFYPAKGDFIGIVGRYEDRSWIKDIKKSLSNLDDLGVQSIASPIYVTGMDFSDHASYWEYGWPAVMVTDTAFLRNKQYHKQGDTADRLNYKKMSQVVGGIFEFVRRMNAK